MSGEGASEHVITGGVRRTGPQPSLLILRS
jgi:hypothetical protein